MAITATQFAVSIAACIVVLQAHRLSARDIRRVLLPSWSGPEAALAEVVLAIASLMLGAQIAGSLGVFHPWPTFAIELALGLLGVTVARRVHRLRPAPSVARTEPSVAAVSPVVAVAAFAGAALVVVQWATHTADALHRGMTHPDTLWYHGPFFARFVQQGSFTGLDALGYADARWFPFNGQVVHALGALAFGRDVLSPFVNLGWLAVALLAAWCLGRTVGAGHLAVLGAAVALGLPCLAATQPGQASTDIPCAALLLAAVALLAIGGIDGRVLPVAGLAVGLSLSTKVSVAGPVAVLVLGVALAALIRRRPRLLAGWFGGIALAGSYWFVRNWIGAGTPLPWFDLRLGPVTLPAVTDPAGPSLADSIGDFTWQDTYLPGLRQAFGRGYFAVLALAVGAAVIALFSRRSPITRLIGAAVLAALFVHWFTPLTGGFSFGFNLRYLGPALLVGLSTLALVLPRRRAWEPVAVGVLLVLVVVNAMARHRERVDAWPTGLVAPTIGVLAAAVAVGGLAWLASRRVGARWAGALVVVTVGAAGLWSAQRSYLDNRYVEAGLHMDDVHVYFRQVDNANVAVFGTDETFPMFGATLSNRVSRGDDNARAPSLVSCRDWREHLSGRYTYVVLTHFGFATYRSPPAAALRDPSAREVARQGDSVVYELDGPLHPEACLD